MKPGRVFKNIFSMVLLSLSLLGATCNKVLVPNTRHYAVAGTIRGGAFYAETLTDESGHITMDQFIDFLEPRQTVIDEVSGRVLVKGKGAAICQSSDDWTKQKTAMEQACALLKKQCTYEMKQVIQKVKTSMERLQKKSQGSNK